MVSRIPYPHAVTHALRGQEELPADSWHRVRAHGAVGRAVVRRARGVRAAYALGPPLYHAWRWAWRRWRQPRTQKAR